jgi:hypothetical protein
MKTKLILVLLALLASIIAVPPTHGDVTRGTEPGEIYFSSTWYMSMEDWVGYYAIFRSTDNGEHIVPNYIWPDTTSAADTLQSLAFLISDATPGIIYCQEAYPRYFLWISQNYGENWEFVESPWGNGEYSSGCLPGEIYKTWTNEAEWRRELHRSINFGNDFILVNDSINGVSEIGIEPGEIYLIIDFGEYLEIRYSNDYGETFSQQYITDTIPTIPQFYPKLSRGTEQGEIYLSTWDWDSGYRYQIYRSTDFGVGFDLQYESDPIDISYWLVKSTAGIEPGSFYIVMFRGDEFGTGTYLKILYSDDYAVSFTEYFHHLTEDFPNSVENDPYIQSPNNKALLYNYPNPFNPNTTIDFQVPDVGSGFMPDQGNRRVLPLRLSIYDVSGNLVKTIIDEPVEPGYHTVAWSGTDDNNAPVPSGVYICQLIINSQIVNTNKMILLK